MFITSFLIVLSYYFSTIFAGDESKKPPENILKNLFIVLVIPVFISILYMFPAFRILGRIPPDRSDITLSFVILAAIVAFSYYLSKIFSPGKVASSPIPAVIVISSAFLIFAYSLSLTSTFASDVYTAKNYSDAYDNMTLQLGSASRQGDKKGVVVPKLPESGLVTSVLLQYEWVRSVVSNYYNVPGIISK